MHAVTCFFLFFYFSRCSCATFNIWFDHHRPTAHKGNWAWGGGSWGPTAVGRRANQANPIPCSPPPSKTPTESDSPWQHPPPPMAPPLAVVGPAVAAPSFRTARPSRLRPRKLPSWPRAALPNDEVSHDHKPAHWCEPIMLPCRICDRKFHLSVCWCIGLLLDRCGGVHWGRLLLQWRLGLVNDWILGFCQAGSIWVAQYCFCSFSLNRYWCREIWGRTK